LHYQPKYSSHIGLTIEKEVGRSNGTLHKPFIENVDRRKLKFSNQYKNDTLKKFYKEQTPVTTGAISLQMLAAP
jgi:hypothetical protein